MLSHDANHSKSVTLHFQTLNRKFRNYFRQIVMFSSTSGNVGPNLLRMFKYVRGNKSLLALHMRLSKSYLKRVIAKRSSNRCYKLVP